MIHLGLVTYNVARDWDFDTLLKNCKESGMEALEFRTTHAHGVEPSISEARRAEVKRRCEEAGLLQISLGSVCEFQSPDPVVVKQQISTCREFVRLAHDIGARGVKVRPNGFPKGADEESTLAQIGAALRECGEFAHGWGVEIWMEVHGGGTMLPANARKIMDHCGHKNVGLTWNSNGTDVVEGSVAQSFELLRSFVRCCHINDLWGGYPYRELFGLLQRAQFNGSLLCEVGAPIHADDGIPFLRCYRALWHELCRK